MDFKICNQNAFFPFSNNKNIRLVGREERNQVWPMGIILPLGQKTFCIRLISCCDCWPYQLIFCLFSKKRNAFFPFPLVIFFYEKRSLFSDFSIAIIIFDLRHDFILNHHRHYYKIVVLNPLCFPIEEYYFLKKGPLFTLLFFAGPLRVSSKIATTVHGVSSACSLQKGTVLRIKIKHFHSFV